MKRVAVVGGAGTWGRKYLRAYASHPECQVIALVDTARERRQAFADHYGVKVVLDSVEDLLAREVPDIVSIILPVSFSGDAVIACARAGVKVVSCEKPIAERLGRADDLVRICRDCGTALACGTAFWEVPYLLPTVDWVRAGHIGQISAAAIARGLAHEVSGGGCPDLVIMRYLTGMEVKWVEGWTLPADPKWTVPPGAAPEEIDCGAYGRMGLSGGIICHIPRPQSNACRVSAQGENGQVYLGNPRPVLIKGTGPRASPAYPDFFEQKGPENFFFPVVDRLIHASDTGEPPLCSGHDYRQALEIAIALKLSARQGHQRIELPLEDRSLRIIPQPYRLIGGDAMGWENTEYAKPPRLE